MSHQKVRQCLTLLALAAAAAAPVSAQDLDVKLHAGIVQPLASTSDYFELGPAVNVEVGYPVSDGLNLVADLGWEWLQTVDIYPTPTTNAWRYRLGVDAALAGDQDGFQVRGLAGVGGTTFRSHEFWLASRQPYTFEGETINQTALTATGGVRLGLQTESDGIQWWLTGKVNWTPIKDINQQALQELADDQLDPLGSALSAAITLGVTLW